MRIMKEPVAKEIGLMIGKAPLFIFDACEILSKVGLCQKLSEIVKQLTYIV